MLVFQSLTHKQNEVCRTSLFSSQFYPIPFHDTILLLPSHNPREAQSSVPSSAFLQGEQTLLNYVFHSTRWEVLSETE